MLKRLLRRPAAQALLAVLLGRYLRLALATTRWTLDGAEHLAPYLAGAPAIIAFWHERLPLMPAGWALVRRRSHLPLPPARVLVSRHADGRFIGALLQGFGMEIVHGSSSRGGAAGMRKLLDALASGAFVGITPDGPRGPRRVAAPGVASLAALSGVAVLPCSAQTSRCRVLRSWDRMVLPLPWGRGVIVCLPPIQVARDADEAALPGIEAALSAAADRADRLLHHVIARLYAGLATLAAPALRAMLRRRLRRGKEIATRLRERWGEDATPRPDGRLLWLHAASVGEAVSVLPVLPVLARQAPDLFVLLTTGTVTSAALLARRLPELGLDQCVLHRFVPLDVPEWGERFLAHWRPDAAGFVEQEIWPNLLAGCARRGVPVMLLNARLSARSAARWRLLGGFTRRLFAGFARIQAQSPADAERFTALGARHVSAPGNLKFAAAALPAAPAEVERLREALRGRPVWLAASTHPGEEVVALEAHCRLVEAHPGLLTIIAPRHPDRGAEIARLAGPLIVARRSAGEEPPARAGIWLADTLGELGLLYRIAGLAFIGGSLVAHGGQNPLEAARLGCAVATGPHTGNFAEIVTALRDAGALAEIADAAALTVWLDRMLGDPAARAAMGDSGIAASRRHAELPRQTAAALLALLGPRQG